MGRRKTPRPEHQGPHELRLREIVNELVSDDSQKQAYLAFAHELAVAERSSSFVHRPSSEVPDFTPRTKRIVQKWFRRGLSGHLMWLIGERILNGYGR